MHPARIAGIILIVLGTLALAYGGFSYTQNTEAVKLGPLAINVKEKKTIDIPLWAGIAALVAGGVLLVAGKK